MLELPLPIYCGLFVYLPGPETPRPRSRARPTSEEIKVKTRQQLRTRLKARTTPKKAVLPFLFTSLQVYLRVKFNVPLVRATIKPKIFIILFF